MHRPLAEQKSAFVAHLPRSITEAHHRVIPVGRRGSGWWRWGRMASVVL